MSRETGRGPREPPRSRRVGWLGAYAAAAAADGTDCAAASAAAAASRETHQRTSMRCSSPGNARSSIHDIGRRRSRRLPL
eukprot:366407-Chlamydomonas_euryale.AAC.3